MQQEDLLALENVTIVEAVDVKATAVSATFWVLGRIADGKDVHLEGDSHVPGDAGKVANQFDGIANEGTEKCLSGHYERA